MARKTTARQDMLHSAAMIFREKGIEATALSDVVEHAHAPRGSIYHHFPGGKPQLAEEATRYAGTQLGMLVSASLANQGPARTIDAIVDMFRQQLVASDYRAGCPVAPGALEGVNLPAARDSAAESFTSWEETISASLWQHGIAQDRSRVLATTAIAAIEGALILARAQRSTQALDRVAAGLRSWLENELKQAAPRPGGHQHAGTERPHEG